MDNIEIDRIRLINTLIDSNFKRMQVILNRNNIKSVLDINELPASELEEWERLHTINMQMTEVIKKESADINK